MQRRDEATTVTATIVAVMASRNISANTLAEATGIPINTLRDRLTNESEFTWGEVEEVGGFFALSPAAFFEGVAA